MTTALARPVLSVPEAATYLGISRRTLERICAQQGQGAARLPVVQMSPGRRGFLVADLDAYLRRQRVARPA